MKGLITALRTLTIIPVPGRDSEKMSSSLFFFPAVGALIGAAVCACAWVISVKAGWHTGAAVLCVALSALLTGGIHLDGLADTFDALGGHTKERRLEIMKDPRIGSFGVVALVMALLLKCAALERICEAGMFMWIMVPFIASRALQVELAVLLPYARAEGGTAQSFVEGAGKSHFAVAVMQAVFLGFLVCGIQGAAITMAACMVFLPLAVWMKRLFGGVTGDLLGMASEIAETAILLVVAGGGQWLK
jgi:adenosylcobinamide-GDP ribazoletransferase